MYNNKRIGAVIAAAGAGLRMGGGIPKQYIDIKGKPMVVHSALTFLESPYIDTVIIVVDDNYDERILEYLPDDVILVLGGTIRQDSVYNGIRALPLDTDYVLVHDGARPYISLEVINRVIENLKEDVCVVPCIKPKDTVRTKEGTLDRNSLYLVQTPQGAYVESLLKAYEKAFDEDYEGTDEASLMENNGFGAVIVEGDEKNLKVTFPSDITPCGERAGIGYDLHKLVRGRDLILAGVKIPYEKGLMGHSDADVVAHAVMDSLLGAMALKDIGEHFPDSDDKYKDAVSLELLLKVTELMEERLLKVLNLDIVILAEKPKLSPFREAMKDNLAQALKTDRENINIKLSTMEGIGLIGREEGIACEAVCLLCKK